MTTACAVLLESGTRAGSAADRYAGTDVVVGGQPFVPQACELRTAGRAPAGDGEVVLDSALAAPLGARAG